MIAMNFYETDMKKIAIIFVKREIIETEMNC